MKLNTSDIEFHVICLVFLVKQDGINNQALKVKVIMGTSPTKKKGQVIIFFGMVN